VVSQGSYSSFFARCVEIAYKNTPLALGANFLNACLLVFLLRGVVPPTTLHAWFAIAVLIIILRFTIWFRFHYLVLLPEYTKRAHFWFLGSFLLVGLVWGSTGIFLFPEASITHQVFLTVVLGGMCAGTAGVFSVLVRFWLVFSLPALFPVIVRLLLFGENIQVAIGSLAATYLVLIFLVAHYMSHSTQSLIRSEMDKSKLIEELRKAKEEAERLNLDLRTRIKERDRAQSHQTETTKHLRRVLGGVIQAIAAVVEVRDRCTAGHQKRVADVARAIATEMNLPKDRIEGLRIAASIHDIGKVAVPAGILSRPSALTDPEYNLVKAHSGVGYNILKKVDFSWPVAEIVYQHHERMNGSGYPQGLSGDDILLEARILAVADVLEAMVSHRPYREARNLDEALEELSNNIGILYDPEVVKACIKLFMEKRYRLN